MIIAAEALLLAVLMSIVLVRHRKLVKSGAEISDEQRATVKKATEGLAVIVIMFMLVGALYMVPGVPEQIEESAAKITSQK